MKIDPNLDLNIEDPTTKSLLRTSAYKIKKIIEEWSKLDEVLMEIRGDLLEMDTKEKKKMKKHFM